jgi:iron complex outermembrane recepter protein
MPYNTSLRGVSASALLLSLLSSSSLAQEALPTIDVDSSSTPAARPAPAAPGETRATAPKPFEQTLPDNIPATVETVTAKQINEQINAITAAEVVKYLPSIDIRERFYGDQNPMIGFRTVTQDTPAQSLIYADGILLSNLLGNYYEFPPVFQMVSPKEITRVDVIYGPFSALCAGNSYGGVLTMTTRMPEKFEFHASVGGLDQRFDLYSTAAGIPAITLMSRSATRSTTSPTGSPSITSPRTASRCSSTRPPPVLAATADIPSWAAFRS